MHPILTVLHTAGGPRPIGSYGVMLAAAMVAAVGLSVRAAVRGRLDGGAVIAVAGLVTAGAMAGAFALFAGVEWARTGDPLAGVRAPGLVFYGAPAGGLLAGVLVCRLLDVPAARLLDLSVPGFAAAHALGRIGCFLGGCCFGRPWDGPWAVRYTDPFAPAAHPSVPRHPVPLYEAALLLGLALAFALRPPGRVNDGRRFALYALGYAVIRFALEMLRGDRVRGVWLGGASTSQLLSAVVALVAAAWLLRRPGRLVSPAAAR